MLTMAGYAGGAALLGAGFLRARARLQLSRAKHGSLTGHARMARRVASLIAFYEYDEDRFFTADNPPPAIAATRRAGFAKLAADYRKRFAKTAAATDDLATGLSDLQFTSAYRVPFQFSRHVRSHLSAGSFLASSAGVTVEDLDGNRLFDLTGSYGVNLFGYDVYKECIARGAERVAALGPVLGAYHPVMTGNVARLRALSGLDEISFHMSGTEAVMQAVRLARYHTGRAKLVRFCGAYHGWWGDVQPGIGNPTPARDTYTLCEMSERTLRLLKTRRDIACVLVNPLQALHPNQAAPSDGALVDSRRSAHYDKAAYTVWLKRLRAVCDERGIALIFDEVFVGFRLGRRGAAGYFGVQPDMVTYGKTLGGGLPVGVLCGRAPLMRRSRADRPVDVCFARGTFNAHPYVMGAMAEFLDRLDDPLLRATIDDPDTLWNERAAAMNATLAEQGLPIRVANLASIWTVIYTVPSRYNWMLQYYLRKGGLALSWVGTGRLIFSHDYDEQSFQAVSRRFVEACLAMREDGWWWHDGVATNKTIRRQILKEMAARRLFGERPSRQAP